VKKGGGIFFDPDTLDLLAGTALAQLLAFSTGEFQELLLAFGEARAGESVGKVIREWKIEKGSADGLDHSSVAAPGSSETPTSGTPEAERR